MNKKVIDLNIITTYPVKWDMYKILRDFIQNFYDSVSNTEFNKRFFYEYKENTLTIRCSNVSFSYEWLLHIGASSKTMDKEHGFAGYFGEGFKIASLCAMRDYHLEVQTSSSDWKIKVIETDTKVDENTCKSLSYEVETLDKKIEDTYLELKNFKEKYLEYFYCALYSFYYEENPLFGEKVFTNERCSIFHRSKVKKHDKYPSSYKNIGNGIIFAGLQARGSMKESLIFCYHPYKDNDRDRNFFSGMDNIDIIVQCIREIPSHIAMEVLILFKSLWCTYPKEKFGCHSYYTVIKNLILKMFISEDVVNKFAALYPTLLYAEKIPVNNIKAINERKYCLIWKKRNPEYILVQDSFRYINVKSLEKKCEEENVLPIITKPTKEQETYIEILNQCMKALFVGFLEVTNLPQCFVIKNHNASVSGYASLTAKKIKSKNIYGHTYKYEIHAICIKEKHLKKEYFTQALTVFIHELCHVFGGDKSENFSYAVTDALNIVLRNHFIIEKHKKTWENLG